MLRVRREEVLAYHQNIRPGKIEVVPSKPCLTQRDLSLAYTPGVAEPVREIVKNPDDVFKYTSKGNLVAVVSNGTAVLGLGNVGALAGKPVMEGKGVLFKRFADIDVFDLEVNSTNPDDVIKVCQLLEPTFGGINLEDIKAPDCFYIEETLKKTMNIPVFHDDQHGTAIISSAALLNALELTNRDIKSVRVVINGAGAAGIACAMLYMKLGLPKENIIFCDTKGVIYKGREEGMNPYKDQFAVDTKLRSLADAMQGAEVFVGLSIANCVSKEMVKSMAPQPIIFALANPDPEITYEEVMEVCPDAIMATGRSDYPNQVNNVLGFPYIFRGALDVMATQINDEMKIAAAKALADLAREPVPDSVSRAYEMEEFSFGPNYIIPKPFDPRVLLWESAAVARAAIETGVARKSIDFEKYHDTLEARLSPSHFVMRGIINKAKRNPKRIVFPEGTEYNILLAAQEIIEEKIATPILLGNEETIRKLIRQYQFELSGIEIVDPNTYQKKDLYAHELYTMRKRRGITLRESFELLNDFNYFGTLMVHMGDADGLISGLTSHYPNTIRPALQILKLRPGISRAAGLYIIITKKQLYFFADTTVNIEPTAEELAEIAILSAETARHFDVVPRVAMLSFSNFGSTRHPLSEKVRKATAIVKGREPGLIIDGEMQADTAVVPEIIEQTYPFSQLKGGANVLIFPDLQSGNIAYKLMARIGGAEAIGPILVGTQNVVHVLQRGCEVMDIVRMTAIGVVDAQELEKLKIRGFK